uniref:Phosducin domain-containing protein n=1 Tax=Gongylonema pulchrum TaxID=637853 RepID=A0A183DWZ5_9BILA
LIQQPAAVNLLNGSTPWEKDSVSKITENPKRAQKKNYIEGVPEGFFEDEKLNSRIDQWKRLHKLELRRDELYSAPAVSVGAEKPQADDERSSSDDDIDVDLFSGWRSKAI